MVKVFDKSEHLVDTGAVNADSSFPEKYGILLV